MMKNLPGMDLTVAGCVLSFMVFNTDGERMDILVTFELTFNVRSVWLFVSLCIRLCSECVWSCYAQAEFMFHPWDSVCLSFSKA